MAMTLEKTVWIYKEINIQNVINQNSEILINFLDNFKYEINLYKYYSCFSIDIDKFFEYPSGDQPETSRLHEKDIFNLKYHYGLILGNYSLNQENHKVTFFIEKVFTNEDDKYKDDINEINAELSKNIITFEYSLINKIFEIDQAINLKLHTKFKNN